MRSIESWLIMEAPLISYIGQSFSRWESIETGSSHSVLLSWGLAESRNRPKVSTVMVDFLVVD